MAPSKARTSKELDRYLVNVNEWPFGIDTKLLAIYVASVDDLLTLARLRSTPILHHSGRGEGGGYDEYYLLDHAAGLVYKLVQTHGDSTS